MFTIQHTHTNTKMCNELFTWGFFTIRFEMQKIHFTNEAAARWMLDRKHTKSSLNWKLWKIKMQFKIVLLSLSMCFFPIGSALKWFDTLFMCLCVCMKCAFRYSSNRLAKRRAKCKQFVDQLTIQKGEYNNILNDYMEWLLIKNSFEYISIRSCLSIQPMKRARKWIRWNLLWIAFTLCQSNFLCSIHRKIRKK